jgi:cobalt-zinc-cadmium efflux system protein
MPGLPQRAQDSPDGITGPEHDHGQHRHGPAAGADPRWLWAALALIVLFMAAEVVTGLTAHSLALISDAAHMLTDAASIGLVLVTMKLAARPPGGRYTYGLKRTEILSAQGNGITLIVLAAWLAYEAIRRLIRPPAVTGGVVIAVALAGVAVNVATTMLVARASRAPQRSLNLEGAFRHLLTDVYAFIATAIAGVVIVVTGFARADAIASLIVVALMLLAGYGLVRDSGRIFLEAAPAGLAPAAIGAHLGDQLGPARCLGARAGRAGRGLPRGAGRPGGAAEPGLRHHPHHPAGGSRAGPAAHRRPPAAPAGLRGPAFRGPGLRGAVR